MCALRDLMCRQVTRFERFDWLEVTWLALICMGRLNWMYKIKGTGSTCMCGVCTDYIHKYPRGIRRDIWVGRSWKENRFKQTDESFATQGGVSVILPFVHKVKNGARLSNLPKYISRLDHDHLLRTSAWASSSCFWYCYLCCVSDTYRYVASKVGAPSCLAPSSTPLYPHIDLPMNPI